MNIPIAMICDDNYIVAAGVSISSIISSKQNDTHYTIYMLCANLSPEHEAMLHVFESDSVSIITMHIDISQLEPLAKSNEGSGCVATPAALLKFELPNILKDEDKVLYLDIDTIVRIDLTELYSTPLDNDLLAAVIDSTGIYKKEYQFVDNYFNSGVMLLNLSLMRKENTMDALIKAKLEHPIVSFMDQTAFNYVCVNRVKFLPIRYNLLCISLDRRRNCLTIEDINDHYGTSYTFYDEIFDDAAIVHLTSKNKPWVNPFVRCAQDWYDIYHRLPSCFQTITDYSEILSQTHITISLTSCPERIGHVPDVIDSLLLQTAQADHIVLYLAKDQFPELNQSLPDALRTYIDNGTVLVTWCEQDLKAHNSYFYAMQEYPDDVIITVDDDERLPKLAIEELMLCWFKYPEAVSTRKTDLITFDIDDKVLPCREWIEGYNLVLQIPSHQLVAIGSGGVLYPPNILPSTAFDSEAIVSTAICASDLWLKANEVLNDIPVVLATANANLRHIGDPQDSDPHIYDNLQDGDDDIFTSICDYFDIYYNVTSLIQNKISSDSDFYNITGQQPLIDFIKPLSHTAIDLAAQLKESNSKRAYYLKQRNKLRDEKTDLSEKLKEADAKRSEFYAQRNKLQEEREEIDQKLQIVNQEKADLDTQIADLQKAIDKQRAEIDAIHSSWTYRIGRFFTWPVRKIRAIRGYSD